MLSHKAHSPIKPQSNGVSGRVVKTIKDLSNISVEEQGESIGNISRSEQFL